MTNRISPISFWLSSLLMVLLVTGCSSTRFGYRFLDDLIRWEINDYVTLYPDQSRALDARLDEFHAWHRKTQLPVYAEFVGQQIPVLQRPSVNVAYLSNTLERGLQLWDVSLDKLLPGVLEMLISLDKEQTRELLDNSVKEEKKYQKEHILASQAERQKTRKTKMLDRLKTWIGTPTAEQVARVGQWTDELSYDTEIRLQQGQQTRTRLLALLDERDPPARFQQTARQLILYPEQQWTPQYQQYFEKNKQTTLQFLVDIHQSLTEAQKAKLIKKLTDYQREFLALSKQ